METQYTLLAGLLERNLWHGNGTAVGILKKDTKNRQVRMTQKRKSGRRDGKGTVGLGRA